MDNITKNGNDNIIPYNEYIVSFLSQYNIIKSIDKNNINIGAVGVEGLEKRKSKNNSELIYKFIYDIGSQILLLKDMNIGIKYFSLSDIVLINSNIFLFNNPDKLYKLLEKIDRDVPSFTYGSFDINISSKDTDFIPIELKSTNKYVYYTGSYYSFAKLLLYFFEIDIEDIQYTSLYFFCKRCLEKNPEDRIFIFV